MGILADLFIGIVCYWVGALICRIVTLGRYPKSVKRVFITGGETQYESGWFCSLVGFIFLSIGAIYIIVNLR